MPRSGREFSLGDFMEVDLAQLEWMPTPSGRTSIFVGKFESVVGIEYRERKSTERFGVTPSLIARYTTGTPLGIKVRSKLGDERAGRRRRGDHQRVVDAPSSFISTTRSTATRARRSAAACPCGRCRRRRRLEVGVSGEWGPQDHALDSTHYLWFAGVDLLAHVGALDVKAQFLKGGAPGQIGAPADPNHQPYGLKLHYGGYVELDWMATPLVGFLARGEVRDADVWLGDAASRAAANACTSRGSGARRPACASSSTSTSPPRPNTFTMGSTAGFRRSPTTSSPRHWCCRIDPEADMTRPTRTFAAVTLALALAMSTSGLGGAARAETRPAPTAADFARLEKEVAEQRQLIIQIMQADQERYDILLKLLQGSAAARGVARDPRRAIGGGRAREPGPRGGRVQRRPGQGSRRGGDRDRTRPGAVRRAQGRVRLRRSRCGARPRTAKPWRSNRRTSSSRPERRWSCAGPASCSPTSTPCTTTSFRPPAATASTWAPTARAKRRGRWC